MHRSLRSIALEIGRSPRPPWPGTRPYVEAMALHDSLAETGAQEAVQGFLETAKSWRGSEARRIKRELRTMISQYDPAR